MQIKELTEKAADADRIKRDADRLKEFLQKQGAELEEYKRKAAEVDTNLQTKYHKALRQIEIMHKDNSELKGETNSFKS